MAAAVDETEVKDFTAGELAALLRQRCEESDGEVWLDNQGLTDGSLVQLAEALEAVFGGSNSSSSGGDIDGGGGDGDSDPPALKKLHLLINDFGDDGLRTLAEALGDLSRVRETLETLDISGNQMVTTLAPLAEAGVLEGLMELSAWGCSLRSGDDEGVLPTELSANLLALEELDLSHIMGDATVTLTAEALCALPAECKVVLYDSKVQVARPSAEDGEMGLVALPTADGQGFGADRMSNAKTVAEICAFAGVQRVTLVKPARA